MSHSSPRRSPIGGAARQVVDAWQVLKGEVDIGASVVADWRCDWVGVLHRLGVEIIPYVRLFGAEDETVYLQHMTSGEPVVLDGVDTLVLALGHDRVAGPEDELADYGGEVHLIGGRLVPRTAEEAVLEGLKVASAL